MPYASLIVVTVGSLWGLYWLPLRELNDVAVAGPWATFAIALVAAVVMAPAGWLRRARLKRERSRFGQCHARRGLVRSLLE